MTAMTRTVLLRGLFVGALASTACAPEYDPTRTGVDPGTFGHRVVTLMCKRLAFQADPTDVSGSKYREACRGEVAMPADAPPTLIALAANRDRLERAIDHVVPADVYDPLQAYLTSADVLALYDDDTMSRSIASLGAMLQEMGAHADAMAAFGRMGTRNGYRPTAQAIGPAGPLTNSAAIRDVMSHVLPTIVDGGESKPAWDALVTALGATFADASPRDGTGSTASGIAIDFLLTEHADLGEATPLPMVRRDARGIAKVALVGGALPAPFVDADGDLLADVDASGNFVDATGAAIAAPTPFPTSGDTATRDELGRALDGNGGLVYEYFDVTKTLIGAMSNDQVALIDPARGGTALDLFRSAAYLMGERAEHTRTFDNGQTLTYRGYDTANSPLLDMAYAFATLLRDPNILDTLALNDELFANHRPVVARLLEAAIVAARTADEHPEAEIAANAALWDDLQPHLQKIVANPELMKDLLDAMAKPETRQVILRFRDQMKYADRFDIASDQSLVGSFTRLVDRTKADSGFNRSLWQRLLHVISDTNGAVECSKAGAQVKEATTGIVLATYTNECEFFRIPNMAVFYLQSIVYAKDANGMLLCETTAGAYGDTTPGATPADCAAQGRRPRRKANYNYNFSPALRTLIASRGGDAYLESRTGIAGQWTHPTPQALNRVLFLSPRPQPLQDTSDPPHDKFGDLVSVKHAGTLPVWERDNFYDQVRPTLQAFADNNAEQIFVDIISVLHEHWSTTQSTDTQHTNPTGENYTAGSNGVSYEPLTMKIFEGDLWPALTEHAAELNAITVRGKSYATILTNAARFLVTPLPGLTTRLGGTTTTTVDGKAVTVLSPWHLIADAYRAKRARLGTTTMWAESTRELVDILFRAEKVSNVWTFKSPHMAAATRATTKLLRDRILEHDAANDRAQWVATDLPRKLEAFLNHPAFAAAADFVESQSQLGAPRAALDQLLLSVFDGAAAPEAYATMRGGAADLIQLSANDSELVPLGHLVGALLAPNKTYLATQLVLLHRMHQADVEATLTNIVARLFRPFDPAGDPGIPALSAIADGVGDVDRVNPGPPAPWSAADYGHVFQEVGAFLVEEQRGMPRFVTIIQERNP